MTSRARLEALIPHSGRMCLLDAVVSWNDLTIHCTTRTHRDPGNPLRLDDQLSAIHLCEYGAQAVAVHGGLLAQRDRGAKASPGMLSSLREVEFAVDRIDIIEDSLEVFADTKFAGTGGWLYEFRVDAAGIWLARGRVSVSLIHAPSFS